MDKKEFKPLSWLVTNFDCNSQVIKYYDVLKYREEFIKKLKKKCVTKEEFTDGMWREFHWQYWSRSEYEMIIEIDNNNRIWLNPWVGCYKPEIVKVDVTDRTDFDWRGFAKKHISDQKCNKDAKIDIFDQLQYRWDEFIDYTWNYRHKYQRIKKNNEH